MPYVKNDSYRAIPFSLETPQNDFYTYSDLKALALKSERCKGDVFKCSTIAVLQSVHGKFFLTDLGPPAVTPDEHHIRVSMVLMKNPLQSTVVPYPVHIFGTLQWKNRPVIFATIIQMLSTGNAIRLSNALSAVTNSHLANSIDCNNSESQIVYNNDET